MDFNPDNEKHWVYLAKAIAFAFTDGGGNISDDDIINYSNNKGYLARSTLTHFRLQVSKTHNFDYSPKKLNNDVARRIWNYFLKKNNNPHVNSFSAHINFDEFKTYISILSFFDSHASKNKKLSGHLKGKYFIYSKSEMFPEGNYVTKGIMEFTSDADGLVIRSNEWHRYDGGNHPDSREINHYFEGYVIERHSQIFIFSKSKQKSTPKFIIIDKRWTDQTTNTIMYMEGIFLKGSFGSTPFHSKIYLVRTDEEAAQPNIIGIDEVDPLVRGKLNF